MPMYQYKAISREGQSTEGILEALSEFEAIGMIKQSYSFVEDIRQVKEEAQSWNVQLGSRKIKEKALAMMCSQMSIVLSEGLPLVRAIKLIANQTADKHLRKILDQVSEDVASGYGLAQSFEGRGEKRLPATFIEALRAGEESGTVQISLQKLHVYFEKAAKIKSKVSAAMAYPILLAVVASIVVLIIMVVAVPMFTKTFASMGAELPFPTRALIGMSNFASHYLIFIILAVGAAIVFRKMYGGSDKERIKLSKIKLTMPVFGTTAVMKSASQFANTMATMLASGLTMTKAISATAKAMDNYFLSTRLNQVVLDVEEGKRLADSLKQCEVFPDLLMEMTAVGEETGSLESTLGILGTFYDNEVETSSAKVLSLLEPMIISVLALFVIFILLAVYLPMFSMYGNIG